MALAGLLPSKRYKLQPHDLLAFAEQGVVVVQRPTLAQSIKSSFTPGRSTTTSTTTTYTSKGSVEVPTESLSEIGSSTGGQIPDKVPQFTSRYNAIRTYESMTNDDAAVDVSLRASKMPVLGADWYVEPGDSSEEQVVIAQMVECNILEELLTPWSALLEDILRFYEYGVTTFEKVYENRVWAPNRPGANRKTYTMLKDLACRPTPTLGKFKYDDNGRLESIEHVALRGNGTTENVLLPASKLVIFTHNRKGGNLEGKSLLRTAYKNWYFKNQFYNIDGIQKERHGMGFPILTLPVSYTKNDLEAAKELVRNIRTNQEAGAVLPPGFVLTFAELKSQPVNVLSSIDHHNGMIMLNIMVQFLLAGVSESAAAGRASTSSAQDMFTKALKYVANMICEQINLQVIPELVRYNFDTTVYPKLRVRNIGETKDMQQWSSAIANLLARNAVTMDYDTEQFIRNIIDFPSKVGGKQTPEANTQVNLEQIEKGIIPGQSPEEANAADSNATVNSGTGGKGDVKGIGGSGNMGKSPSDLD